MPRIKSITDDLIKRYENENEDRPERFIPPIPQIVGDFFIVETPIFDFAIQSPKIDYDYGSDALNISQDELNKIADNYIYAFPYEKKYRTILRYNKNMGDKKFIWVKSKIPDIYLVREKGDGCFDKLSLYFNDILIYQDQIFKFPKSHFSGQS
jgi:hypothetical protein